MILSFVVFISNPSESQQGVSTDVQYALDYNEIHIIRLWHSKKWTQNDTLKLQCWIIIYVIFNFPFVTILKVKPFCEQHRQPKQNEMKHPQNYILI